MDHTSQGRQGSAWGEGLTSWVYPSLSSWPIADPAAELSWRPPRCPGPGGKELQARPVLTPWSSLMPTSGPQLARRHSGNVPLMGRCLAPLCHQSPPVPVFFSLCSWRAKNRKGGGVHKGLAPCLPSTHQLAAIPETVETKLHSLCPATTISGQALSPLNLSSSLAILTL